MRVSCEVTTRRCRTDAAARARPTRESEQTSDPLRHRGRHSLRGSAGSGSGRGNHVQSYRGDGPRDIEGADFALSGGWRNGASLICSRNRPSGIVSASTRSIRGTRLRRTPKIRSSWSPCCSARYWITFARLSRVFVIHSCGPASGCPRALSAEREDTYQPLMNSRSAATRGCSANWPSALTASRSADLSGTSTRRSCSSGSSPVTARP